MFLEVCINDKIGKAITCAIVEDEPLAIQMVSGYIENREDLKLVAIIDNLEDFYNKIGDISPAILFLDFKIPGFDDNIDRMLESIPENTITVLISATPLSYFQNTYHLQKELNIYELLKPFSMEMFNECIENLKSGLTEQNRN